MHVIVNAAVSADGKLSTRRREQVAISGETDFGRVDRIRAESDAILVGVGTVLADDPSLIRHDEARRDELDVSDPPARVVADSRGRTPADAAILGGAPTTYLLASETAPESRLDALRDAGATVVVAGDDRVDLTAALAALEEHGVERLMVEGGGEVIFSLFAADLVDELSVFVGPVVLGGRDAPTLADGEGFLALDDAPSLTLIDVDRIDGGVVLHWSVD